MAIAIEGFSVVALKSRIEKNFDGGIEALSKTVPNATELADDDLWRCSFMAAQDAESFLKRMEDGGLNLSQNSDPDAVIVNEFDLSVVPYCEWLVVGNWAKGVIAQRIGSTSRTLIAREGWTPEGGSGLSFVPDNKKLEFRRVEGNLHVYFDKETGKEVFVAHTEPDPDAIYKQAAADIFGSRGGDHQSELSVEAAATIEKAIVELEKLAQRAPNQWRIHFMIGKGRQKLGEFGVAYDEFQKAYALEKETEPILRELVCTCMELGKGDEAVKFGQKAASLQPDNAETLSNLTCAYLLAARIPEARTTIDAAFKLKPWDGVNQNLNRVIHEVQSGMRPQPCRISDLLPPKCEPKAEACPPSPAKAARSPAKTESLWSRLWTWRR